MHIYCDQIVKHSIQPHQIFNETGKVTKGTLSFYCLLLNLHLKYSYRLNCKLQWSLYIVTKKTHVYTDQIVKHCIKPHQIFNETDKVTKRTLSPHCLLLNLHLKHSYRLNHILQVSLYIVAKRRMFLLTKQSNTVQSHIKF